MASLNEILNKINLEKEEKKRLEKEELEKATVKLQEFYDNRHKYHNEYIILNEKSAAGAAGAGAGAGAGGRRVRIIPEDQTTSITVIPSGGTYFTGTTQQLEVINQDDIDVIFDCVFTSANETIATVNTSGLISVLNTGTTVITTTHNDGPTGTTSIAAEQEVPSAPTNLTATNSVDGVELTWTNVSEDADNVRVFVSTDNILFVQLGVDLSSDIETYTHDISDGVLRYYKVVAVKNSIVGGYSNMVYEIGWVYFDMESVQTASINQVLFEYDLYPDGDVWIDWGNDTVVKLDGGFTQSETSNYSAGSTTYNIQVFGELDTIKRIKITNEPTLQTNFDDFAKFPELETLYWRGSIDGSTGTTDNLPSTLLDFYIYSTSVTLTYANLPNLEKFENYRTYPTDTFAELPNTLRWFKIDAVFQTGVEFDDIPKSVEYLHISQLSNPTGTALDLPPNLLYLVLPSKYPSGGEAYSISLDELNHQMYFLAINYGATGDPKDLASTLKYINIEGTLTVTPAEYPVWANTQMFFDANLTETYVDQFLNNWQPTCGEGTETINLAYSNAPRSSASDAAVTDMETNKSKTFVFNT